MATPSEGEQIDKQKVEEFFDKTALLHGNDNAVLDVKKDAETAYANIYRDYYTRHYIHKYVSPASGDVILDFGCGVGRIVRSIAPLVKEIHGVDISTEMIKVAKENFKGYKNVHFEALRNPPLPYADKSIDKIFSHWVVQHISAEECVVYFKEFLRILKPGGKLLLFEQVKNLDKGPSGSVYIQRTSEEYVQLLKKAGFNVLKATPAMRVPSRGMSLWNKLKMNNPLVLKLLSALDDRLLLRKPQFASYYTNVFVCRKG